MSGDELRAKLADVLTHRQVAWGKRTIWLRNDEALVIADLILSSGLFPERAEDNTEWVGYYEGTSEIPMKLLARVRRDITAEQAEPIITDLSKLVPVVSKPLDLGDGTAPPEENFWDDRTTPLASSEHESEVIPWGPATTA